MPDLFLQNRRSIVKNKMIKSLFALVLVLGLTACAKSANTESVPDTEKTVSESQENADTETSENKEELNNAGNIEIRITEKYSPQTLELESVSLDYSVHSRRIETENLLIPSVLTLRANDKSQQKIYLSKENTNALRNMSIQIYDELIEDNQGDFDQIYQEMCTRFADGNMDHMSCNTDTELRLDLDGKTYQGTVESSEVEIGSIRGAIKEDKLSEYKAPVRKRVNDNGAVDYSVVQDIQIVVKVQIENFDELESRIMQIWDEDVNAGYDYVGANIDFIDQCIAGSSSTVAANTDSGNSDENMGVVGRWVPDHSDMYYCIELNMTLTGTLYRADKTYPLTYTFDGKKVRIVTDFDGSSIKSEYYFEDGKLISDQDNTIFIREE